MEDSIARKTVSSTAWTYLSYGLTKGANFITTAVLARLLSPAEFGIVGYALTIMSFLDAVRDLGLGLALIQRRERVEEAADTVFILNIAANGLMWLVTLAIAPLLAALYDEPQLVAIVPVLGLSFVVSSFGATHDALLQREMRFSRRVVPALSESISKSIVSIGLALAGGSVWALVIGQVVGRATFSVVVWRVISWRPRFRFHRDLARELFGYGYKIAIDSFLSALQANVDYLFIGLFLGDVALGLYTIAFRVPELVIINLCIVVAQVLFPAYAAMQDNIAQLRSGMLVALRYIAMLTVPSGVGLALVSPIFITTIFGPEWADAAPIMGALALYGMFLAVSWNIGDVYKAVGRPDILWKTAVFELALLGFVLYFLAQQSALAVAYGHMVIAFLISLVRLGIAVRLIQVSPGEIARQFVPSVAGSVLMGVAVWLVLHDGAALGLPDAVVLLLAVLAGIVVYALALWRLEPVVIRQVVGLVRDRSGRDDDDDGAA